MKGLIAIAALFMTVGLTACEQPLQAAHFNQARDQATDKQLESSESPAKKVGEKIDQSRL
jgi:hypothetical protein